MKGDEKIILGIGLLVFLTMVMFRNLYEGKLILIEAQVIYIVILSIPSYLIITGMSNLKWNRGKFTAELKDGDYSILSSLVLETRRGKSNQTYFKGIDEFDLQNAMNAILDITIAVHLFLVPAYYGGSMKHYIIPAGKIPARLWPLMLPGNIIRVENGFVSDIHKPNN